MGNTMATKTPEEMAEDYSAHIDLCCGTSDIIITAQLAFLAGYEAAKPKWISVKDRLPKQSDEVLVFGQCLNDIPKVLGVRCRYQGDQEWKHTWESENETVYHENDVTHWMPLPEAPKDEL